MIPYDEEMRYDPDCSTCSHRVKRHKSRRASPATPVRNEYVCLVCAKAIGEHGSWTQTLIQGTQGFHAHEFGKPKWVQDVPCKAYDRHLGKWVALDYEMVAE